MADELIVSVLKWLDSRQLGRVHCVNRKLHSLIEEAARVQVQGTANFAGIVGARAEGERWLKVLNSLERVCRPLEFTRLSPHCHARAGDVHTGHHNMVVRGESNSHRWCHALCGDAVMRGGVHHADFTIVRANEDDGYGITIGMVLLYASHRN